MDEYTPQSPDLSALDTTSTNDIPPAATSNTFSPFDSHQIHTYEPPPLQQNPTDTHTRESFSLPAGAGSSFLPIATQPQHRQQQHHHHHTSYQPHSDPHTDPQPQYGDPYSTAYNNHIAQSSLPQQQLDLQNNPTMPKATQSERTRARPRRNPTKPTPTYQDDDSHGPSDDAESLPSPTSPPPPPQASYMPLTNINNTTTLQQVPDPTLTLPSAAHDITIKTKFPLARIKRIVQADEDVGKVAQATPVAVAKALEQFMIQLAMSSAAAARGRGSRRVTAGDMKAAVGREGVFDFLEQVVSRIGDVGTGKGGKGKNESSPDVESVGGSDVDVGEAKRGKKRGRGAAAATGGGGAPRRRKKGSDDD